VTSLWFLCVRRRTRLRASADLRERSSRRCGYASSIAGLISGHRDDATVAVFSHGAAIRVYTAFAARLPVEQAVDLRIMNTGMSVLEAGLRIRSYQRVTQ
jgi:hypothetical protein